LIIPPPTLNLDRASNIRGKILKRTEGEGEMVALLISALALKAMPSEALPKLGFPLDIYIAMTLNQPGCDVDAHLVRPGGRLGSPRDDCHPRSPLRVTAPDRELFVGCFKITGSGSLGQASHMPKVFTAWDWGRKGFLLDDPFVLHDATKPGAPEIIGLAQAERGVYKIYARYERDEGAGPVSCWLWLVLKAETPDQKVYLFGPIRLERQGEARLVCAVKMPEGELVEGSPARLEAREASVSYAQAEPEAPFPEFEIVFEQDVEVSITGKIDVIHILDEKGRAVFTWSGESKVPLPVRVPLLPGKYRLCAWRNGLEGGVAKVSYFVPLPPAGREEGGRK